MIEFKNMTTGQTLTLGTVGSEYVLAHKDFGTVEGKNNTTPYINLIGSDVNSTTLAERDISFIGFIKTESKAVMEERKRALKKMFNPQDFITAYFKDYALIFKPTQTVKDSTDPKENTDRYYRFSITGIAYDPLWRLKKSDVVRESATIAVPLFPLVIPAGKGFAFGYIPAVSVNNVLNEGDVEVGFVLRMTATGGTVNNPKIIDNKTGDFIEVAIEMTKDDVVELSTENGKKYAKLIRGEAETDIFKNVTTASTMSLKLHKGINDITITSAGNSSNMTSIITFSPQWLEVV